ncbi:cytochrome c [Segetibacter sp. 3557_3]|nr:cytochrome c [Segetibacter sp. 3557_3]
MNFKIKKMKKLFIISLFSSAVVLFGCETYQRKPARQYMPDMGASRAYETYSQNGRPENQNFNYNNMPVSGTVNRGEELPYHLGNDSAGYSMSATVTNPLKPVTGKDSIETQRLYMINCAICHGSKLDGNGPLYASGKYPAKPATLVGDANIEKLSEGTIFHVQTYGKNLMGSYASQLTRKQRWMIANYIKQMQAAGKGSNATGSETAATDTSATGTGGGAATGTGTGAATGTTTGGGR